MLVVERVRIDGDREHEATDDSQTMVGTGRRVRDPSTTGAGALDGRLPCLEVPADGAIATGNQFLGVPHADRAAGPCGRA